MPQELALQQRPTNIVIYCFITTKTTFIEMEKKYYLHLLTIILIEIMSFSFVSCGNDDDSSLENKNVELLKGDIWIFQKATVNAMGQTFEMSYREIRRYMEQAAGTSNMVIVDEKLRFTDAEMIFVNTGDRVSYTYYSNGDFTFDGLSEMNSDGMTVKMRIKGLTSNQLVFTLTLTAEGMTINEDLYYKR